MCLLYHLHVFATTLYLSAGTQITNHDKALSSTENSMCEVNGGGGRVGNPLYTFLQNLQLSRIQPKRRGYLSCNLLNARRYMLLASGSFGGLCRGKWGAQGKSVRRWLPNQRRDEMGRDETRRLRSTKYTVLVCVLEERRGDKRRECAIGVIAPDDKRKANRQWGGRCIREEKRREEKRREGTMRQ